MSPEPNLPVTATETASNAIQVWPYLWAALLSAWGGVVNYIEETSKNKSPFMWRELTFDIVTSSFVGVLTYLFCRAAGIEGPLAAVLIGISGHMGPRAIASFTNLYNRILGTKDV